MIKKTPKLLIGYSILLLLALIVFSIPWYSGHYRNWNTGSYEYKNISGWYLIEWQWNKTLDDSSFPYLIGIGLGIIAIAIRKYRLLFFILTLIAGSFMLHAAWQCLINGYNSLQELDFQPPEVIKAGGVLAFITPVAYMIIGSILFFKSISPDELYKVPPKTAFSERYNVWLAVAAAMSDKKVSSLLGGTIDATANNVYISETTRLDVPTYIVGGIESLTYAYSVSSDGSVIAVTGPLAIQEEQI